VTTKRAPESRSCMATSVGVDRGLFVEQIAPPYATAKNTAGKWGRLGNKVANTAPLRRPGRLRALLH
jgi:hypothetical protein